MPSNRPSRRELLRIVGIAIVTASAGCTGDPDDGDPDDRDDEPRDPRDGPPPGATTDFDSYSVRARVDEPFVRTEFGDDRSDDRSPYRFILDADDADAIEFAIEIDRSLADEVRSFVAATEFDRETVVISHRAIDECYERHAEYVIATEDEFRVRFCRNLRPATVACDAEREEMEAVFLRVPYAYDEPPSSRGSQEGSQCLSEFWERGDRS